MLSSRSRSNRSASFKNRIEGGPPYSAISASGPIFRSPHRQRVQPLVPVQDLQEVLRKALAQRAGVGLRLRVPLWERELGLDLPHVAPGRPLAEAPACPDLSESEPLTPQLRHRIDILLRNAPTPGPSRPIGASPVHAHHLPTPFDQIRSPLGLFAAGKRSCRGHISPPQVGTPGQPAMFTLAFSGRNPRALHAIHRTDMKPRPHLEAPPTFLR